MAKVILLKSNGYPEFDDNFRRKVKEFASFMFMFPSVAECEENESFQKAFSDNGDCMCVFTLEGDQRAQFEGCTRGRYVFEWDEKEELLIPVHVSRRKRRIGGMCYHTSYLD